MNSLSRVFKRSASVVVFAIATWTTGVTRADVDAAIAMTKDSGFIKKDPDVDALLPQEAGG